MPVSGDEEGRRGGTSGSAPAGEPAPTAAVTVEFDTAKPNIARVYDVLLGGKDNYASDRELAERIVALNPGLPGLVRDNRVFITKAVTVAASRRGIRQFIDLGAGLPTHPSIHEVAQGVSPDARVAYVDNDPVVQSHIRALLAGDGVAAISADITRPAEVLADPELAHVIDFGQPVCVILAAVLHFQPAEVARSLIAAYAAPLAAGSALVVSMFSAADEEFSREASRAYTAAQWHSHSPAEVERWLREAGLRPLRGLVGNVSTWPLDPPGRTASLAETIGDLAEKLLRPGRAGLPPPMKAQGVSGSSAGSAGTAKAANRPNCVRGIQRAGQYSQLRPRGAAGGTLMPGTLGVRPRSRARVPFEIVASFGCCSAISGHDHGSGRRGVDQVRRYR